MTPINASVSLGFALAVTAAALLACAEKPTDTGIRTSSQERDAPAASDTTSAAPAAGREGDASSISDTGSAVTTPGSPEVGVGRDLSMWIDVLAGMSKGTRSQTPSGTGEIKFDVGVEDGEEKQIFGRIRDIAVDGDGGVVVLDQQALFFRWFGPSGAFRGEGGRHGDGPMEFRAPMALELTDSQHLAVLDQAHHRISMFELGDSGVTFQGSISIPIPGLDFCVLDGVYYVLAPRPATTVTVVDSSGHEIGAFAPPVAVEVPHELQPLADHLRDRGNSGRILCHESPPKIVIMSEMRPDVRAFDPDGKELWHTTLAGYHAQRWTAITDRQYLGMRMAADPSSGTSHWGSAIALLDNDLAAIALSESNHSFADPWLRHEVRILSMTDGRELHRAPVGLAVAGARDGTLYGYVNEPFPRVMAWSRPPGSR
ncbi:MAG: NHL repeat-containing protein [Longimicrobiales bacterium]